MWNIIKKILLIILIILSGGIVIFTSIPWKNGMRGYMVLSGSMEPKIKTGDLVIVKETSAKKIKINEIIAFYDPNDVRKIIVHRVTGIDKKEKDNRLFFTTKGDANKLNDYKKVVQSLIIGQALFSVPYAGYFLNFLRQPLGLIIFLVLPCLIIIVTELRNFKKHLNSHYKNKFSSFSAHKILLIFILGLVFLLFKDKYAVSQYSVQSASNTKLIHSGNWQPPTTSIDISGDGNWHGYGWYKSYDKVTILINNGEFINYQILNNDLDCPEVNNNQYISNDLNNINLASIINTKNDGVYSLCYYGENNSGIKELEAHKQLLKLDRQSPTFSIDFLNSKLFNNIFYINSLNISLNIEVADNFSGYTKARYDLYDADDNHNCTNLISNNEDNLLPPELSTNRLLLLNNLTDANYCLKVWVYDDTQNQSATQEIKFTIDTIAPSVPSFSISKSWTKIIEEKVFNGDFETGDTTGFTKTGSVSVLPIDSIDNSLVTIYPIEGNYMTRIGNPYDPGNWSWENRLMTSFPSGAKSFSLFYNFYSRDNGSFDSPGFFIRLNGQEIFRQNNIDGDGILPSDTNWQKFYYDLSDQNNKQMNLGLYAGNTGDKNVQSWVYIDKISTYFVSAPQDAQYKLICPDTDSFSQFKIDDYDWQNGSDFFINDHGEHTLEYRCSDLAGNYSLLSIITIITDTKKPSEITDLIASSLINAVTLYWSAPFNDYDDPNSSRASQYDIRYSTSNISSDEDFNNAFKLEKIPSPSDPGKFEQVEVTGLNPDTNYYFAIKTSDEAPNWSDFTTTSASTALTTSPLIASPGDVVINELMWMGSSVSYADEWLELRNLTDRTINLSSFYFTRYTEDTETLMDINLNNKSISPFGYFLIANSNSYAAGDSELNIEPNVWDSSLDLDEKNLQIKLYYRESPDNDHLIDTAWDTTPLTKDQFYSMERVSQPGDGTNPLNWYTCVDTASTAEFFDAGADERGTPGAPNRSENEPLPEITIIPRPTPIPTETIAPFLEPFPTESPTPIPTLTPELSPTESPTPTLTLTPEPSPVEPEPTTTL